MYVCMYGMKKEESFVKKSVCHVPTVKLCPIPIHRDNLCCGSFLFGQLVNIFRSGLVMVEVHFSMLLVTVD